MSFAAVILAAGKGVRMHSPLPKVLHTVCGRPLVEWVLNAVRPLSPDRTVVVVGAGAEQVRSRLSGGDLAFATQDPPRGTGDAVRAALSCLEGYPGPVMVLPGDTPLISTDTLRDLVATHGEAQAKATILSFLPADPGQYGRVIRAGDGTVLTIVEARDADPEQLNVREVNSGMYMFDGASLRQSLEKIRPDNAQGEYYLTDVIGLLPAGSVAAVPARDSSDTLGVNTPAQLAQASARMRERLVGELMASGVRVTDPASTVIAADVEVGPGSVIHPFVVLGMGVTVGRDCQVGPFCHLRDGTRLADGAWVGNFVEIKNSTLAEGCRVGHLAYLGDARLGPDVNVGAGVITANFDGREKHETRIDGGASLGAGSILVAPVRVGKNAVTGAGSVLTRGRDVADGATVVGVPARPLATPGKGDAP